MRWIITGPCCIWERFIIRRTEKPRYKISHRITSEIRRLMNAKAKSVRFVNFNKKCGYSVYKNVNKHFRQFSIFSQNCALVMKKVFFSRAKRREKILVRETLASYNILYYVYFHWFLTMKFYQSKRKWIILFYNFGQRRIGASRKI